MREELARLTKQNKQMLTDLRYLEAVILDLFDGDSEKKEEYMSDHMRDNYNVITGEYIPKNRTHH